MAATDEKPIAELTQDLSAQTATLVRKEIALATAELKEKGQHAGVGVGLFGGAGVLGFYALGALIATLILGLSELMAGWLAALIVTVLLLVVAGISALIGKREVGQATPLAPEQAKANVKLDIEATKQAVQR